MEIYLPAAESLNPDGNGSVAVVLTRSVRHERAEMFESGLRELISAATTQPGQLDAEVLRGARIDGSQDYHIVYRFADRPSLQSWEATPERKTLVARLDALATDAGRHELTGMEAWFDLPAHPSPPRVKMALLTWLGIWPLVTAALLWLAPRLSAVPLLARTAIITALLVLAMTYLVMPRLARLAAPWLLRPRQKNPAAPEPIAPGARP
jgi:antibiotic biosynthesis monooxygenase (ABM) superfamily enzyme